MLEETKRQESKFIMSTFARYDVEFVRGEGMWLFDDKGEKYLDFLAGIAVCSLGHSNKALVSAISEQASKLMHVSNYFYIENRAEVAQHISDLLNRGTNEAEDWKSFFTNSGAESNECALKIVRLAANQKFNNDGKHVKVVTLKSSFHGRTMETLAATAQSKFHVGYEPMSVVFVEVDANDCEQLKTLFERSGDEICAMIVEPIQGESGVHPLSDEYMKLVRDLTRANDAFMICDEVQTGIFRSGHVFAFQSSGVLPDIVTMAKGIGGGFPCGVCSARGDAAKVFSPGQHGTTFGGSNLACAAIKATLTQLDTSETLDRINETGPYLASRLSSLEQVCDVRGKGLMLGADLAGDINAKEVAKDALLNQKLIINATSEMTLRFVPPLIATKADVDECIERLQAAKKV